MMDKKTARQVLQAAFRSGSELEGLLRVLKEKCAVDECQAYARGIASVIDSISVALTNKVLAEHPELADEIEANLKRSGRAV